MTERGDVNGRESGAPPARAGITFRPEFLEAALSGAMTEPAWFEVHAEDYMSIGAPHDALDALSERFPLSVHGVGLTIGAERDLDPEHLARLAAVVDRHRPALVSEHLAWSSHDLPQQQGQLPPPYDETTLDRVCRHIDQTQEAVGRSILIENPSTQMRFTNSTMEEPAFLSEVVRRTGCGLLLDVNNVFVSAANNRYAAEDYLDAFPVDAVREVHLGGHRTEIDADGRQLLVDSHDRPVDETVWALFARLTTALGPMPTLIEWDDDQPDWTVLEGEARRANAMLLEAAAAAA